MGQSGLDVQLSERGMQMFGFAVECKHRAKMAIYDYFRQAEHNGKGKIVPLLIIKQDRSKPLAVLDLEDFFKLL